MKEVLIFFGGALSGAAICFLCLDKKYKDKVNKEIDSLQKTYNEMFEKQLSRLNEAEAELKKGSSTIDDLKVNGTKVNYTSYSKDGVKFDPETFHDKSSIREPEPRDAESLHPVDSDEDEEPEEDSVILTQDEKGYIQGAELSNEHAINRNDKPKLIKYEDYGEDGTLEQATLLYYVDNDILVTEDEEEIPDPAQLVGDCLDKFDFRNNDDEKTIFVRNSKLGFDYEITKVYDSYTPRDI